MARDRLFLLAPDFADPAFPGRRFYCWHCALLEGVVASFPALAGRIDVVRVPWARPRRAVVDLIGEANQSLPMLVLANDAPVDAAPADDAAVDLATGTHRGIRFVAETGAILRALTLRHGLPEPHP